MSTDSRHNSTEISLAERERDTERFPYERGKNNEAACHSTNDVCVHETTSQRGYTQSYGTLLHMGWTYVIFIYILCKHTIYMMNM